MDDTPQPVAPIAISIPRHPIPPRLEPSRCLPFQQFWREAEHLHLEWRRLHRRVLERMSAERLDDGGLIAGVWADWFLETLYIGQPRIDARYDRDMVALLNAGFAARYTPLIAEAERIGRRPRVQLRRALVAALDAFAGVTDGFAALFRSPEPAAEPRVNGVWTAVDLEPGEPAVPLIGWEAHILLKTRLALYSTGFAGLIQSYANSPQRFELEMQAIYAATNGHLPRHPRVGPGDGLSPVPPGSPPPPATSHPTHAAGPSPVTTTADPTPTEPAPVPRPPDAPPPIGDSGRCPIRVQQTDGGGLRAWAETGAGDEGELTATNGEAKCLSALATARDWSLTEDELNRLTSQLSTFKQLRTVLKNNPVLLKPLLHPPGKPIKGRTGRYTIARPVLRAYPAIPGCPPSGPLMSADSRA